uniref:Helitron helicase-like domain-containing protein n=1 Tax=Tanacetum cinerariifolium TaxID=118510 RepID=A0A6L2LRF8_TANCI|nr:hypothetical protein [Tanacetum cinerariifolium]
MLWKLMKTLLQVKTQMNIQGEGTSSTIQNNPSRNYNVNANIEDQVINKGNSVVIKEDTLVLDSDTDDENGYIDRISGISKDTNDGFSLCCGRGKVRLPVALKDPPPLLRGLMNEEHPKSKTFMENIRRYNSMFSFTSFGGNVDNSVNTGRGPFCFRIQEKNTHSIGDLLPKPGDTPKFYQLYIYDPANEIENHTGVVSNYNVNLIVSVPEMADHHLRITKWTGH